MTQPEINNLKNIVQKYAVKKNSINQQIKDLEKARDEFKISHWIAEIQIIDLYKELTESDERNEFIIQAKKTETDVDFEKNFRSIFFEFFFNVYLDPNKL